MFSGITNQMSQVSSWIGAKKGESMDQSKSGDEKAVSPSAETQDALAEGTRWFFHSFCTKSPEIMFFTLLINNYFKLNTLPVIFYFVMKLPVVMQSTAKCIGN